MKVKLAAVIISAIIALVALSLFIANFFVPIKYLKSYFIKDSRAEAGAMRVSFIDVGYGSCTLVELPDGKIMLIDGGDGSYSSNLKIFQILNGKKIDAIDYLLCSSLNSEHCGGLAEILKYKKVSKIYMPYCENPFDEFATFCTAAEAEAAEIVYGEYALGETGEDWFFKILSPSVLSDEDGEYADFSSNRSSASAINNYSAVVWLEYAGAGFLFTGDAETEVLKKICSSYEVAKDDYPAALENCKVLAIGHGSEYSLYKPLYGLLKAEFAIISVGENGENCPSENVIAEVSAYSEVYRTDEGGSVILEVDGNGSVKEIL